MAVRMKAGCFSCAN